jgi:hypothetical protein
VLGWAWVRTPPHTLVVVLRGELYLGSGTQVEPHPPGR